MKSAPPVVLGIALSCATFLGTPRLSADPPVIRRAAVQPTRIVDACIDAAAQATASWSGTALTSTQQSNRTSYAASTCGRFVADLDVGALHAIPGYGTSFTLQGMPVEGESFLIGNLAQPQCQSLVVDLAFYRVERRSGQKTRFAGGRKRGVWHPEEPSVKCQLESTNGFTEVGWLPSPGRGTARYRLTVSAKLGATPLPVLARAVRRHAQH